MAEKYKLDKEDMIKLAKRFGLATTGAILDLFAQFILKVDFQEWTPIVYAATPVVVRDSVPTPVMGPPVRPAPALTCVTVPLPPPEAILVIVKVPPTLDTLMPVPATMLVTPALLTVMIPVLAVRDMPVPANRDVTPAGVPGALAVM